MPSLLTLNSGSSSLKASLFGEDGSRRDFHYTHLGHASGSHAAALDALLAALDDDRPDAIGHRFVHGGEILDSARLIDDDEFARLHTLVPLAPLHLPGNLLGVELCRERFNVPQLACFDTAFHHTLPESARRLPIPREFKLRRYGFHGLNYAHIAQHLPEVIGEAASGRVVVAHLGSGASLCLLDNLRSVDTSMGYTPAGGIPMATRSGDLDPGVMLELAQRYDHPALAQLVYHSMGLLALSNGESADMQTLLTSPTQDARFAVEYFCTSVRAAIGSYAAKAGGLDALVFTGGIGQHAPVIRAAICDPLRFIGFELNSTANHANLTRIDRSDSKPIAVIPADEEAMICGLVQEWLEKN
ncbi:MAG: acetate kinase [Nitrosomonadales bacterium]|nr:acetate kinase [Nitrosomonadales bacterium]